MIVFAIYAKGANGPYLFDDVPNLVKNDFLIIDDLNYQSLKEAALSSPSSKYYRPLSMLTFVANYTLAGNKDSFSIKLTNILIHIITGMGVFLLSISIYPLLRNKEGKNLKDTETIIISLCITSFWLLHPFFVSTVLYSIQRMAMLPAMVIIFACFAYVILRKRCLSHNKGHLTIIFTTVLLTCIAFLCKENGLLLPGFLLLIEYFCFGFRFHDKTPQWAKASIQLVLIIPVSILFVLLVNSYFTLSDVVSAKYGFTVHERFLSQTRILWNYVGWLTLLNPQPMSIFNDTFEISVNLIEPKTTLLSILSWLLVILFSLFLYLKRGEKIIIFSVFWFLYGHLIESSTFPLSLMF